VLGERLVQGDTGDMISFRGNGEVVLYPTGWGKKQLELGKLYDSNEQFTRIVTLKGEIRTEYTRHVVFLGQGNNQDREHDQSK
jgi:hypothetical protein